MSEMMLPLTEKKDLKMLKHTPKAKILVNKRQRGKDNREKNKTVPRNC